MDFCGRTSTVPSFSLGRDRGDKGSSFRRGGQTDPCLPFQNPLVITWRWRPLGQPFCRCGRRAHGEAGRDLPGSFSEYAADQLVWSVSDSDKVTNALLRQHPFDRLTNYEMAIVSTKARHDDDLTPDGSNDLIGRQNDPT